jgi:PCFT/HCP family folate transporter-like MFS transporter 1/3
MFALIPSMFAALLIGAWTDTAGRRPALVLPAIGSALEALIVLCTIHFEWPIYVLFVGSAISGTCGSYTTMVLAVMAYIADTSDESNRSFHLDKERTIELWTTRW